MANDIQAPYPNTHFSSVQAASGCVLALNFLPNLHSIQEKCGLKTDTKIDAF